METKTKSNYGSHDFVVLAYLAQERHSTEANIRTVLGMEGGDVKALFGNLLRDKLIVNIEPGVLSITDKGIQKYLEFNQGKGLEPIA